MESYMGYMYAAIFIIAGLILIFQISKENKIFYLAGGYMILLGAWWCIDTINPALGMFTGTVGIIFKVISGIVLVILGGVFLKENLESRKKEKKKEKSREEARAKARLEAETDEKKGQ